MKNSIKTFTLLAGILFFVSCGDSKKEEKEEIRLGDYPETQDDRLEKKTEEAGDAGDGQNELSNKGVGPVKSVEIDEQINEGMASTGANLFNNLCSACHRMDRKLVGPALGGVSERRSPEWIMNMILNPQEMVKEDPIAKKLLAEFNGAVMIDQNLTEEEARSILEHFRKYDQEN